MLRLTRRPHPFLAFLASGARAASMAAPFFTTEGRLMRGAGADLTKQFVPVHKGLSLIQPAAGGGLEAALVSEAAARPYVDGATETLIGTAEEGALGRRAAGGAFWLLDVSHLPEPPAPAALGLDGATWQPLRDRAGWSACDRLEEEDEASLLAIAAGLAKWHDKNQFCGVSGGRTVPEARRQGRVRSCAESGERLRPRVDPSVIMLVVDGDRCLLGRKAEWPAGRYSTLAGFVEFGESLEECLVREVYEEAGVRVKRDGLRFVASQPWLFPRSLMVGFIAQAEPGASEAAADAADDELQDVGWFSRDQVRAFVESGDEENAEFHVPSKVSLARVIIEEWIASGK